MSIFATGCDYSTGRPAPAAIRLKGCTFAVRYLASDPLHPSAKSITPDEYHALVAAGVSVPFVFETYSQRALGGYLAGVADAKAANAAIAALGLASLDVDRPVYFAIDFDPANATAFAAAMAYLRGASSVRGKNRTGVYGGYRVVKACLDGGVCSWAWQTRAWSTIHGVLTWDSRAHMRQVGWATIGGFSVDSNVAMVRDYGQFPKPPALLDPHQLHELHAAHHPEPLPKPPAVRPAMSVHPAALRVGYTNNDVRIYQTALRNYARSNGINVGLFNPSGVTGVYGHETSRLTEAVYQHLARVHRDNSWIKGNITVPGPKLLRLLGLGVA